MNAKITLTPAATRLLEACSQPTPPTPIAETHSPIEDPLVILQVTHPHLSHPHLSPPGMGIFAPLEKYTLILEGPDGSLFEFSEVPAETSLQELTASLAQEYSYGGYTPSLHGAVVCMRTEHGLVGCDPHLTLGALGIASTGATFCVAFEMRAAAYDGVYCTLDEFAQTPSLRVLLKPALLKESRKVGFGLNSSALDLARHVIQYPGDNIHLTVNIFACFLLDIALPKPAEIMGVRLSTKTATALSGVMDIAKALFAGRSLILVSNPREPIPEQTITLNVNSFFLPLCDPSERAFAAYVKGKSIEVMSMDQFLDALLKLRAGGFDFIGANVQDHLATPLKDRLAPFMNDEDNFLTVLLSAGIDPRSLATPPANRAFSACLDELFLRATPRQIDGMCRTIASSYPGNRELVELRYPEKSHRPLVQGRGLSLLDPRDAFTKFHDSVVQAQITGKSVRECLGLRVGEGRDTIALTFYDYIVMHGRSPEPFPDKDIESILVRQTREYGPKALLDWMTIHGDKGQHDEEILRFYEDQRTSTISVVELIKLLDMLCSIHPAISERAKNILDGITDVYHHEKDLTRFDQYVASLPSGSQENLLEVLKAKMIRQPRMAETQPRLYSSFTVFYYRFTTFLKLSKAPLEAYLVDLPFDQFSWMMMAIFRSGSEINEDDWRMFRRIFIPQLPLSAKAIERYKGDVESHLRNHPDDTKKRLINFTLDTDLEEPSSDVPAWAHFKNPIGDA